MARKDYPDTFRFEFVPTISNAARNSATRCDLKQVGASHVQFQKSPILWVDDEIVGTMMGAEILREPGYSVDLCHSPFAALCYDLSKIDLVIVDFEMPGLNGKELLLCFRALGTRFPVILLAGSLEALSHEGRVLFARSIDKGMPFDRLQDTVEEFLNPDQPRDYGS